MKIVIAPDSFKESLSAPEAAAAIEAGFREFLSRADYLVLPAGRDSVSNMSCDAYDRMRNEFRK